MEEPDNHAALVARVQAGFVAFEEALAPLDARQLTTPGAMGDWSVKDVLAHLTCWHLRLLDILDPMEPARVPGIPPQGIEEDQIEGVNARFYAENRTRPLDKVLAAFRGSYQQVLAQVQALSDADLSSAERFPLLRDSKVIWVVAGNTYEHYEEHLSAMQAWLVARQR